MTDMRAADSLARRLHAAGCGPAFGMPGGEVQTAINAVGIGFILCRHQHATGFMSEAAHHVDEAPAILVAMVGPGAMNGVDVVATAEAETCTHQVLHQRAVFTRIPTATFTLSPGAAAVQADEAVRIAKGAAGGRAGPVQVDVPISVADAMVPEAVVVRGDPAPSSVGPEALATAAGWLGSVWCLIVFAGLDAVRDGAGASIRAFRGAFGVPLVTTCTAKGLLDEAHPMALVGAGLSPPADTRLLPLLREAVLIVPADDDPIEIRPGWRDVWHPAQQTVIDAALASKPHGMNGATLVVVAPIGAALDIVRSATTPTRVRDCGETRAARREAFAADDWGPGAVIEVCCMPCPTPRSLLPWTGLRTIGCALPLGLRAQARGPGPSRRRVHGGCGVPDGRRGTGLRRGARAAAGLRRLGGSQPRAHPAEAASAAEAQRRCQVRGPWRLSAGPGRVARGAGGGTCGEDLPADRQRDRKGEP